MAQRLTFSPGQLDFAWQTGTPAPQTQYINAISPAGTQVTFTVSPSTSSCGGNWLSVQPTQASATNGVTPTPITVSINVSSLPSITTTCVGNVEVSVAGASNGVTNIPVSLLVSTNPLLLVSPPSLTFNVQRGGGTPASQVVQMTSSSSTAELPFTYTVNPGSPSTPDFLNIFQTNTSTPGAITVGVTPTLFPRLVRVLRRITWWSGRPPRATPQSQYL